MYEKIKAHYNYTHHVENMLISMSINLLPVEEALNMDVKKIWSDVLAMLEKSLSDVVFTSMISQLIPLKFENNVLHLQGDDFFKTTINQRYIYEITHCVRIVTHIEDVEVQITSPEDLLGNTKQKAEDYAKTNLRQKYNFDTFVKGKSNELAYAAAYAVAEAPGKSSYNPLFLYGGVGLGKTHLIQSIGNYVVDQNPELKVLYQSTEAFTNELIAAIREKSTQSFKEKYRSCDVLLLDDIQFLKRAIETQEEMFHTFNTLHNDGKQIVFTSDLPPKELTSIEKRLTTRFGMGLIVDVTLPDYETRTAILDKKLATERIHIPDDVKELIVLNIVSNIRDLEGALNKITAYSRLTNTPITLELSKEALKDQLEDAEKPVLTIEYVRQLVSDYFNLSIDDINGRKRTRNIVFPRQIAMYLCRKILPDASLPQIGTVFGGRDHTTVMHSCDKIAGELEYDQKLQDIILDLERKILGSG